MSGALLDGYDILLLDLDGVVSRRLRGDRACRDSADEQPRVRRTACFRDQQRLANSRVHRRAHRGSGSAGVTGRGRDIGPGGCRMLAEQVPAGSRVLVVGVRLRREWRIRVSRWWTRRRRTRRP